MTSFANKKHNDFELFENTLESELFYDLGTTYGNSWFKEIKKFFDNETREQFQAYSDFLNASFMDSYTLREFSHFHDEKSTQIIDREISYQGKGFEAEVTKKTIYDVIWTKNDDGVNVVITTVVSEITYALQNNGTNDQGETQYSWKVTTREYDTDGNVTSTSVETVDAKPRK